jgi:CHAD domain-containing protein
VAAPVVGKPARKLSAHLGDMQDALGAHQDGAVAEAWLRRTSGGLTKAQAVVAGELIQMQRSGATAVAPDWRAVWARAASKKESAWLR